MKLLSDNSLRSANARLALFLTVLFLGHAFLGAVWIGKAHSDTFIWVIFLGMVAIGVHVITCCFTSYRMLHDERFPPSKRKKMHLVLKWVTGAALLICAVVHITVQDVSITIEAIIATIVLAALAWHTCVCVKSLLKDLGAKTRWKNFLVVVILLVCVITECALVFNVCN